MIYGNLAAGIQANWTMLDILQAWEKKDLMAYGRGVQELFRIVPREDLISGMECNGHRFYINTEEVDEPLTIARINKDNHA